MPDEDNNFRWLFILGFVDLIVAANMAATTVVLGFLFCSITTFSLSFMFATWSPKVTKGLVSPTNHNFYDISCPFSFYSRWIFLLGHGSRFLLADYGADQHWPSFFGVFNRRVLLLIRGTICDGFAHAATRTDLVLICFLI